MTSGADRTANNQLRYFRERDWEVDCILSLNDKASWAAAAFRKEYHWLSSLTEVQLPNYRWNFGSTLMSFEQAADLAPMRQALAAPADVFYTNYVFTTPLVRHLPAKCLRLLETHDIMSDQFELSGDSNPLPSRIRKGRKNFHYRLELDLYRMFDGVVMINDGEAARVRGDGAANTHYVPPCIPTYGNPTENPSTIYDLLFVGSRSGINRNGIDWFLRNVFDPFLAGRGVRLAIVGDVCETLSYSHPNIAALGRVDTKLDSIYANSAIVIAPVFEGTGLSIKTVEAMGMGKVVVTDPCGARGIDASQLVTLDMKAHPEIVASTILRILADPAERRALECRALAYANREFGNEAYFNAMDRLFESIGIAAGTRRTKAA